MRRKTTTSRPTDQSAAAAGGRPGGAGCSSSRPPGRRAYPFESSERRCGGGAVASHVAHGLSHNRNRPHPQSLLVMGRLRLRRHRLPLLQRHLRRRKILASGAVPCAAQSITQLDEPNSGVALCWPPCSLSNSVESSAARSAFLAGLPTRVHLLVLRNADRMSAPARAAPTRAPVGPLAPLVQRWRLRRRATSLPTPP